MKKAQKMEGENRARACPYACKIEKCYLTSVASELLGEMAYRTVAVFPHCTPTVFIGAGSRGKGLPRLPSSLPPLDAVTKLKDQRMHVSLAKCFSGLRN